jgi:hypothetical protein
MFRHKNKPKKDVKQNDTTEKDNKKEKDSTKEKEVEVEVVEVNNQSGGSSDNVKDLLEKNLKWSQIIYEQNRKINHKLMWAAVAGWLRLILILAPLVLALLYLPPIAKSLWSNFDTLTGYTQGTGNLNKSESLEKLLKVFNLNSQQKEQLKTILK